MKQQIREFIASNFYLPDDQELTDESSLLDEGIVDSTGILEVIGFIEDSFGIQVEDVEMLPDNLDSIAKIAAFIERKKK